MFMTGLRRLASVLALISIFELNFVQFVRAEDIVPQIGNILGGIVGAALGIVPPKQYPAFKKYVAPYINNTDEFDDFIKKYANRTNLTEKENIYVLIKLGVPAYRPQWLTASTREKIQKYYPGFVIKHAYNNKIILASNDNKIYGLNYTKNNYEFDLAATVPATANITPLFGPGVSAAFGDAIATLGVIFNLSLTLLLSGDSITPEGMQAFQNGQSDVCASPGVSCVSGPAPVVSVPQSGNVGVGIDCEALVQSDEAICRGLKNPAAKSRCWASANERYGNCRAGRPIGPLHTN